jgi:hypothetical protein
MEREPAPLRWFQREHALELFREHRIRLPSDAGALPAEMGHAPSAAELSKDADGVIVEYMDNRGVWEPAKVSRETFRALSSVASGATSASDSTAPPTP